MGTRIGVRLVAEVTGLLYDKNGDDLVCAKHVWGYDLSPKSHWYLLAFEKPFPDLGVYGTRKVWNQLRREDFDVARDHVGRLMDELGLCGVTRTKRIRTTKPAPVSERPGPMRWERPHRRSVSLTARA